MVTFIALVSFKHDAVIYFACVNGATRLLLLLVLLDFFFTIAKTYFIRSNSYGLSSSPRANTHEWREILARDNISKLPLKRWLQKSIAKYSSYEIRVIPGIILKNIIDS